MPHATSIPHAIAALGLLALSASAPAQTAARFRALDTFTGVSSDSVTPRGLSADGRIVIGDVMTDQGLRAFRWSILDGPQAIGSFPNPGGAQYSSAHAISADGLVIVGGSTLPTSLSESGSAFRWTQTGGMTFLGSVGGTDGGLATAVSADGSVIVGQGSNAAFAYEAFRWTAGTGVVPLGGIVNSSYTSTATGVSGSGATVVGFASSGFTFIGTRWTEPTGTQFLTPTGLAITAISSDGSTFVGLQGAVLTRAFFVRDDLLTSIPRIADLGLNDSDGALAVSADGSVVVGYGNRELDSNVSEQAFIWDAANGTRSIQQMLTQQFGVNLAGWSLKEATAISADGRTIAGWGYGPPNQTRQLGWIVQLGDSTLGECCSGGGACAVSTRTSCDGNWTTGGTCATGACPVTSPATGPCCDAGACTLTTQAACTATWSRGGACDPNPCQPPVPMGACCSTFSTECTVTQQDSCFGDWTQDAPCTPTTCQGPMGACCAADHTCTEGLQSDCATGTFHAFASCSSDPCNPPPSGACCTSATTFSCAVRTQATCTGRWIQGISCSPSPCGPLGACCSPTSICTVGHRIDCGPGDTFISLGVCDPNPCAPPEHVCCRGCTCVVVTDDQCTADQWTGVSINPSSLATCSSADNPSFGCCAADYDKSGSLAVGDIFAYLNAWFAASPYSDANGSGSLEVADIFSFLNAWFAGCQ